MTSTIRTAITALLVVACTGCAGYRLNSSLPDDIKTISVPTFRNDTAEPDLDRTTTRETISELQRDGTLTIAREETGDIHLKAVITSFTLSPVRYNRNFARVAEQYRVTLRARITVTRESTGAILVEDTTEGFATFEGAGDLATAKRTAIPEAARDLAKEITNRIVEVW